MLILTDSLDSFPTPTKDSNSWYHPSLEGASGDEEEPTDVVKGNWGRKTTKGARWLRKGKLAAWGPGMEEWEVCIVIFPLRLCLRSVSGRRAGSQAHQVSTSPRQSLPITPRITASTVTFTSSYCAICGTSNSASQLYFLRYGSKCYALLSFSDARRLGACYEWSYRRGSGHETCFWPTLGSPFKGSRSGSPQRRSHPQTGR